MSQKRKDQGALSGVDLQTDILEQLPAMVMAVDLDLKIVYMNAVGRKLLGKSFEDIKGKSCADLLSTRHCQTADCGIRKAIETGTSHTARNEVTVDGKVIPIEYTAAPLKDDSGRIVGGVEYIVDITDRVISEERLREQSRTIQELSTPAIKLWDEIVILPAIGVVDSARAQQMMDAILDKVMQTSSKVIILDIQGVVAVDTAVANHLIKITKATRLMGCQCIISGISPAVAQTIVQLGIDLEGVATNATLRDALQDSFELLGLEIRKTK